MPGPADAQEFMVEPVETRTVGRIPVRNLWILMLYASDLVRLNDPRWIGLDKNADELPDLVAELLCRIVEQRLRRNLSFGYRYRNEVLTRVRGRIDILQTARRRLLEQIATFRINVREVRLCLRGWNSC